MSNDNKSIIEEIVDVPASIIGGVLDGLAEVFTLGLHESQSTREANESKALYNSSGDKVGYEDSDGNYNKN
jgi:hypothetical protein